MLGCARKAACLGPGPSLDLSSFETNLEPRLHYKPAIFNVPLFVGFGKSDLEMSCY